MPLSEKPTAGMLSQGIQVLDGYRTEEAMSGGEAPNGSPGETATYAEPVAVVGMSMRLPGGVNSGREFWDMLIEKRSGLCKVPPNRYNVSGFHDASGKQPGTLRTDQGYFLHDFDPRQFDTSFFSLSQKELEKLDPQQRQLLEVAYECLEDAGVTNWRGSDIGCYVGVFGDDWQDLNGKETQHNGGYRITGYDDFVLGNRISYEFDLHGPSEAVNAIYIKRLSQALQDGDEIRAVIRGTSVNCDGKTPGMLMPSATAQESLMRRAYRQAHLEHRLHETAFVECHGTGTAVGDPLETTAVAKTFGGGGMIITSVKPNVGHSEGAAGLTSLIKAILAIEHRQIPPNIYFETPNPRIPFKECNIRVPVDVEAWPKDRAERVSVNSFGIGGVNAHVIVESLAQYTLFDKRFQVGLDSTVIQSNGYAGTEISNGVVSGNENADLHGNQIRDKATNGNGLNGHALRAPDRTTDDCDFPHTNGESSARIKSAVQENGVHEEVMDTNNHLLLFSAHSEESLQANIAAHRDCLENTSTPLRDVAFTLANRRLHKQYRAYGVSKTGCSLEISPSETAKAPPTVGWVFTGQGAQWPKMGAQLIDTNVVFRQSVRRLEAFLKGLPSPISWSIEDELRKGGDESRVHKAEMGHPLSIAVQIGLIDVLHSWNVSPDFVVGHSSGEMAAAYACGSVTAEAAMAAATFRGTTSSGSESEVESKQGTMAAIGLGRYEIQRLMEPGVVIACENSHTSVTISGDAEKVEAVVQKVKEHHRGVLARLLKVEKAFHSHHMLQYGASYEEHIKPFLDSISPEVPFYSAVTGKRLSGDGCLGAAYWRQNMESPVLFDTAMRSSLAANDGRVVLLEIGPHPALKGPLGQILRSLDRDDVQVVGTLDRQKECMESLLHTAGRLFQLDVGLDLSVACPTGGRAARDLPRYRWKQEASHWAEPRVAREWRFRQDPPHELLGSRVVEVSNERCWRNKLMLEHVPWLSGHKVNGQTVFPAAGYISMVGEALRQLTGDQTYTLKHVSMPSGLVLEHGTQAEIVTRLTPMTMDAEEPLWYSFCVTSHDGTKWVTHCFGQGRASLDRSFTSLPLHTGGAALNALPRKVDGKDWYKTLNRVGFQYSGAFEGLENVSAATCASLSVGTIPAKDTQTGRYSLHPGVIDRCFQLFTVSAYRGLGRDFQSIAVPTFYESIVVRPTTHDLRTAANISTLERGSFMGDLESRDNGQQVVFQVKGFKATALTSASNDEQVPLITNIEWRPHADLVQLEKYMHPRERSSKEWHVLEELTLLCVLDHQERIAVSSDTAPHLVNFHKWMQHYIEEYKVGHNPLVPSSQRLSELSVDQRLQRIDQLQSEIPASRYAVFGIAIVRLFSAAAQIFKGEAHPLHILMEDDVLTQIYVAGDELNYREAIQLLAHTNPKLRILEVGAGTGGTTAKVLQALNSACGGGETMYSSYTYTDVSAGFMTAAKERFARFERIDYAVLDITQDPVQQGFVPEHYDLIIASNVVHATPSLNACLRHLRALLRPGGRLFLQELCPDIKFINYVMGFLPGWWLGAGDGRVDEPYISPDRWSQELVEAGFDQPNVLIRDGTAPYHMNVGIMASPAATVSSQPPSQVVILCHSAGGPYVQEVQAALESLGITVGIHIFSADNNLPIRPGQDVIALLDLEEPLVHGFSQATFTSMKTFLTGLRTKLIWVIPAAQINCDDPRAAMTIGLARTTRNELSAKVYTVELDRSTSTSDAAKILADIFLRIGKPTTDPEGMDPDWEYAVVKGQVLVPRFHWKTMLEAFSNSSEKEQETESLAKSVSIRTPGMLQTMEWTQCSTQTPQDGQVVIQTKAVGLNFRDVLIALGVLDNSTRELGLEACGVVTAIGRGVEDISVGDRVAFMGSGCFRTHATVAADVCVKIPNSMTFEQGAALPCVYVTAAMALTEKACLQRGQTILIHSACGGVGLAAIQIAQMIGAEIFCTVGNEEKAGYLFTHHQIPRDHIFNSRDSSFKSDIMAATHNKGVDVVLNSLSGELLHASWECVAEFGVMVEIGKRDLRRRAKLSMEAFEANRTFVGLDLWQVSQVRPEKAATILRQCMRWIRSGAIKAGAIGAVFEAECIVDAFRFMQGGQHIGKIVVRIPDDPRALKATKAIPLPSLRSDRSYVLAGGFGGLGRAIATWMVENGAGELVFMSRSAGTGVKHFVDELESQGCQVRVCVGSVTCLEDVKSAIRCATMPIAGAINLTMVLRDVSISEMSFESWQETVAPKVQGTWNLHHALPEDLDFFVLFSSYSGIVGQWGQANYAAANTFLDAFVQFRNGKGQSASVIDVGVMGELGFVWDNRDILEQFRKSGMRILKESELLDAMHLAIQRSVPRSPPLRLREGLEREEGQGMSPSSSLRYTNLSQVLLGLVTTVPIASPASRLVWRRDARAAIYHNIHRLADGAATKMATSEQGSVAGLLAAVAAQPGTLRQEGATNLVIVKATAQALAKFLIKDDSAISLEHAPEVVGVDSLVAMELRNWIRQQFDVEISVMTIVQSSSLLGLADSIRVKLMEKHLS